MRKSHKMTIKCASNAHPYIINQQTIMDHTSSGQFIKRRLDELAASGSGEYIWRPSFSKDYMNAAELLKGWLDDEGFRVYVDPVGNVFGRIDGESDGVALFGSHLDTVKDGGKYDGAAGIVTALTAISETVRRLGRPRKSIEVVALVEEEGSRFLSSYTGSKAITGKFSFSDLDEKDSEGISIRDALRAAGLEGWNEEAFAGAARSDIDSFVELHIEQGPVLENKGLNIGVVTSIVGLCSYYVTIRGKQNHAGTTPMSMRLDPVAAASEFIVGMTEYTRMVSDSAVFTVGGIHAYPGISNVIADSVRLELDFRDGVGGALDEIRAELRRQAESLEAQGFEVIVDIRCDEDPVSLDPGIVGIIDDSVHECGLKYMRMNSGAGHDSQIFADMVPTGMIFIPSHDGISHSPLEYTSEDDLARGEMVLEKVIEKLAY